MSATRKLSEDGVRELRAKKVREEIPDWEARRLVASMRQQGLIKMPKDEVRMTNSVTARREPRPTTEEKIVPMPEVKP